MSGEDQEEVQDLEILSAIGFDGTVPRGFLSHPDGMHFIYPLGSKVIILNWDTKKQTFLTGHTNTVSTMAVSPDGRYVASGQINHMGFKAFVYLWDFETASAICRYELHKVRVQSVCFTTDSQYLLSLGGRDDSSIIVWDVNRRIALCAAMASTGTTGDATVILRTNLRGLCFLTAGDATVRLWTVCPERRQIEAADVKFGQIKRNILCAVVDERDTFAYCGTSTGDVVKINLCYSADLNVLNPVNPPVLAGCYGKYSRSRRHQAARYSQGVTSLALWPNDTEEKMIIGAGDGTVELTRPHLDSSITRYTSYGIKDPTIPILIAIRTAHVDSKPTSLQIQNKKIYVATVLCEIFSVDFDTFDVQMHITCHTNAVYNVVFPYNYTGVFATCSKNDIRLWNTETSLELLHITTANFICHSIQFARDGKSIISGWNDGEIRAFTPETGQLMYEIHNAHNKGVTAIAVTSDMKRIVSGGGEGQVRVWEVHATYQTLVGILQEHKGPVSCLQIASSDKQVVSASTDGTCVIWDIERMVRQHSLFANTQFMAVAFHPSGVQVITCGTDRRIGYWEVYDGSLVREVEGSQSTGLNAVDISRDGQYIVTGGNDQYVKIWKYNEGIATFIGAAHAGVILDVRFSPDNKYIMSVSSDGGVIRWKCPYDIPPFQEQELINYDEGDQQRHSPKSSGTPNDKGTPKCSGTSKEIHTPKSSGTAKDECNLKSSGTPKETNTPKSSGTPKDEYTSKGSSTPKEINTPKSSGTPKDEYTSKSSGTPKGIHTPKKSGTGTPKSSGTPKGIHTPKSSSVTKSNGAPKGNGIANICGTTPKNIGTPNSSAKLERAGSQKNL